MVIRWGTEENLQLRQNRNKDEGVKFDRGSAARVLRVDVMDEYDEQLRKEMIEDQLKGIEDFEWCGTSGAID